MKENYKGYQIYTATFELKGWFVRFEIIEKGRVIYEEALDDIFVNELEALKAARRKSIGIINNMVSLLDDV